MSGVEAGKFSRAEPQSAPQNATSVSGTPQSITAERKENGGKLAGKSASTKQVGANES